MNRNWGGLELERQNELRSALANGAESNEAFARSNTKPLSTNSKGRPLGVISQLENRASIENSREVNY